MFAVKMKHVNGEANVLEERVILDMLREAAVVVIKNVCWSCHRIRKRLLDKCLDAA